MDQLISLHIRSFNSQKSHCSQQEKITRVPYGEGETQEKFVYQQSLVFVQCVINALFALVALKLTSSGGDEVDRTPTYMYLWCSMSYMGAMLASNTALRWVNYPTQVHESN